MKKDEGSPRQSPEEYLCLNLGNGGKARKRKLKEVTGNREGEIPR